MTAPGHKTFSVQEMGFKASQSAERAERRVAAVEARLASAEARIAEKDQAITELASAYSRVSDTISALSVVVQELEAGGMKGVSQVLTGLEGRIKNLEELTKGNPVLSLAQIRAEANECAVIQIDADGIHEKLEEIEEGYGGLVARVDDLETKPKRGRPRGSKNKPKVGVVKAEEIKTPENGSAEPVERPQVEKAQAEGGVNSPQGGESSNPEASEA